MVRRGDEHGVDGLVGQQFTEVGMPRAALRAVGCVDGFDGSSDSAFEGITSRDDLRILVGDELVLDDVHPSITSADQSDRDPVRRGDYAVKAEG